MDLKLGGRHERTELEGIAFDHMTGGGGLVAGSSRALAQCTGVAEVRAAQPMSPAVVELLLVITIGSA